MSQEAKNTDGLPDTNELVIKDLKAQLQEQEARISAIDETVTSLEETVNALLENSTNKAAKSTEPSGALKGHTFGKGKDKYRLRFPTVSYGNKTITEDDLLLDSALAEKLIKEHPGLFEQA